MLAQILAMFIYALDHVITWFGLLMTKTGAGSLYMVMMSVVLTISLLLAPLIGSLRSAGSDKVKSSVTKSNKSKNSSGG